MSKDLPMIKKEGIFTKIKKWVKRLVGKEEIIIEPVQEITKDDIEKIKEDSFREGLKVKSKDVILFLQKQLESKQIQISDLTEEQMDEMIELYETQIIENKKILERKDKIIKDYEVKYIKIKKGV